MFCWMILGTSLRTLYRSPLLSLGESSFLRSVALFGIGLGSPNLTSVSCSGGQDRTGVLCILPPRFWIFLLPQCTVHPGVNIVSPFGAELNLLTRSQERRDLLQARVLHLLHANEQSQGWPIRLPSGSSCIGIAPFFRLILYWTRLEGQTRLLECDNGAAIEQAPTASSGRTAKSSRWFASRHSPRPRPQARPCRG